MAKRNFYEVLEVSKEASADEIKKKYRTLAMKYHPDRNANNKEAEAKFKELNEAYEILKDDQKRAAYDRFGAAAFEQGGGFNRGSASGASGFESSFTSGGFSDIFEEVFSEFMGGGQRRSAGQANAGQRGADKRHDLKIPLEEAYKGGQRKILIKGRTKCTPCQGSGAEKGSKPIVCSTCNGRGVIRAQQGFFSVERTCSSCHGQGQTIQNPCKSCSGTGTTMSDRHLNVSIPAGIEDGSRIRIAGEGEAGYRGAQAGDLYIFVEIQRHNFFERDSSTLYCQVPISIINAALGHNIEIPLIEGGQTRIVIPEGTQSGKQFRLKGKGMSILRRSTRGDMIVQVQVETPVNLTKKQRELLQEFTKDAHEKDYSPHSEKFIEKVKRFIDNLKQ